MKLIFGPTWFNGVDVAYEIVSVVVTLLIALVSYKIFLFCKDKKFAVFGLSFSAISLSFLAKIMTNLTIYYHVFSEKAFGPFIVTVRHLYQSNVFYMVGFFVHRFFMLLGLYGLYYILYRKKTKEDNVLFLLFFIIVAMFSTNLYIIYYITTSLILFLIVLKYYGICCEQKFNRTRLVFISFAVMLLSQILFLFIIFDLRFYVVAESVQLLGYSLLLINFLRRNGKKDKSRRHK